MRELVVRLGATQVRNGRLHRRNGVLEIRRLSSPLPLAATVPYLQESRRRSLRARPAGPGALAVGLADLAADAVGLAAMIEGSLRYRSLVL